MNRGQRTDGRRMPWVCLLFHDITPKAAPGGGGPSRFAVPAAEFERQLDQLAGDGFRVVSLRTVLDAADADTIAVSFDDGDLGQYERGFPALAARGMSATFFVTTDWVGQPGYVSWGQLREMSAAGMDIQSHTRTHRFLSELPAADLRSELRVAKAILDDQLGQETATLALPGGDWPRRSLRPLIVEAGYRAVATSRWGLNDLPHSGPGSLAIVHRCTVQGIPGVGRFARIAAGDRWLSHRRRVRETALGTLRSALGPSRYSRWRGAFLDAVMG